MARRMRKGLAAPTKSGRLCNLGYTTRIARGARRRRRNRGHDALLDAFPVERETANAQLDWQVRRAGYCQRSHRWMLEATRIDAAGIGSVCAAPGAPIVFRLVPDERNPKACWKYDWPLSLPHTFRETGDTASITSPGGITSKMTQTSSGVYAADYFTFGTVRHRAVVDAASSPKSLTITESGFFGFNCRFSGAAP